jgi:hypothetical protein
MTNPPLTTRDAEVGFHSEARAAEWFCQLAGVDVDALRDSFSEISHPRRPVRPSSWFGSPSKNRRRKNEARLMQVF